MEKKEILIKELLEDYPTVDEQLELNLFDLEVLKEYYIREKKRNIAIRFENKKRELLKY